MQKMYFPSYSKSYCNYRLSTKVCNIPLIEILHFFTQSNSKRERMHEARCMALPEWKANNRLLWHNKLTILNRKHKRHNYIYQAENRGNSQPKSESRQVGNWHGKQGTYKPRNGNEVWEFHDMVIAKKNIDSLHTKCIESEKRNPEKKEKKNPKITSYIII